MDQPHEKLTMTSSQLEDSGNAVLPIAGVNRWDAALLAVALTLAACLTISYMSHEYALYWSD